jgi:hypothetical protein
MEQPNVMCVRSGMVQLFREHWFFACCRNDGGEAVVVVLGKSQTILDGFVWPPIAVRASTKLRSACLPACLPGVHGVDNHRRYYSLNLAGMNLLAGRIIIDDQCPLQKRQPFCNDRTDACGAGDRQKQPL